VKPAIRNNFASVISTLKQRQVKNAFIRRRRKAKSKSVYKDINALAVYRARELKRKATPAELKLLKPLGRAMHKIGLNCMFQHPIITSKSQFFIMDFYITNAKLCIELDGAYHRYGEQQAKDKRRDTILKGCGIETIRISNADVLQDYKDTVNRITSVAISLLGESSQKINPEPTHRP